MLHQLYRRLHQRAYQFTFDVVVHALSTFKLREMIREELEYMPPVRLREVEEVQQRIIEVVRRMEEEGQITLGDGAGSDMMV